MCKHAMVRPDMLQASLVQPQPVLSTLWSLSLLSTFLVAMVLFEEFPVKYLSLFHCAACS